MKRIFKQLYLNNFLFYCLMGIILLFAVAYLFPALYHAVWYALYVLIAFVSIDILLLFGSNKKVIGIRNMSEKLSNGDENEIHIALTNQFTFPVHLKIIDEIPFQFQQRNFEVKRKIKALAKEDYRYFLRPNERGE